MEEKIIVLTTYGKDKTIEKLSISLYPDNYDNNANHYCTTINSLKLEENSWIYAKIISDNTPYNIEQFIPYSLKHYILKLESRALQKVIREVELKNLALALVSECEEVRNKVFQNMTKNSSKTLKEEIEFFNPSFIKDIRIAQDEILKIILELIRCGEIISPYDKEAVEKYL